MSGTMMAVPSTSLTAVASLMVRKYRKNRIVLYQSMKLHARLVVSDKAEASQPMTWLYNMGNQLKAYWSRCFLVFFCQVWKSLLRLCSEHCFCIRRFRSFPFSTVVFYVFLLNYTLKKILFVVTFTFADAWILLVRFYTAWSISCSVAKG